MPPYNILICYVLVINSSCKFSGDLWTKKIVGGNFVPKSETPSPQSIDTKSNFDGFIDYNPNYTIRTKYRNLIFFISIIMVIHGNSSAINPN